MLIVVIEILGRALVHLMEPTLSYLGKRLSRWIAKKLDRR